MPTLKGRKTAAERRLAEREKEDARWRASGYHFRLFWTVEKRFGPGYEKTLEAAIAKRDKMIERQGSREIPADLHERRGQVSYITVYIEQWDGKTWTRVTGSERTGVWGTEYPGEGTKR